MSLKSSEQIVKHMAVVTSTGTQRGEPGFRATTEPMGADLQAKAVRKLEVQAVHQTDRVLRGLVAQSNVQLKDDNNAKRRTKALSTSHQDHQKVLQAFRLAFSQTTVEFAEELFTGMILRGLSYRNDGAELADAKMMAYVRMLRKYPPDAAKAACERLRPTGWLPSSDTLEMEIREMLAWRLDTLKALEEAQILTPEQLQKARERRLALKFIEIFNRLPFWDTGSERCAELRRTGIIELTAALNAFEEEATEDHDFKHEQANARRWIEEPFVAYPYNKIKTEAEKQKERDDFRSWKDVKVSELLAHMGDEE